MCIEIRIPSWPRPPQHRNSLVCPLVNPDSTQSSPGAQHEAVSTFRAQRLWVFYPVVATTTILAVLVAVFIALVEVFKPVGKRGGATGKRPRLPPGPRGVPLLGNRLSAKVAFRDPQAKLLRGLASYDEMATLHLGSKTWIVLNIDRVASELIAKPGSLTNTRSPLSVSSGIVLARRPALEFPEVFAKARREIDNVCGADQRARLPAMEDMEALRYICAMAKEVLQWWPLFVVAPEHSLTKDIDLEGYHFPKGVTCVINGAAVADECEHPERFDPDRWMDGHEMDIVHGM